MGGGIKEGGLGTQRGDELRFPILRDYFECASTAFIMTRFRFAFVSGRAKAVLATSDYQMHPITWPEGGPVTISTQIET